MRVRFVSEEEAASLPLRKEPARGGILRLVEVEGFDLSACGGTHVASTGAVGIIAVTGFERFKGGTRVEFVCGGRVLARFRQQRDVIASAVRRLSVLPPDLPDAIERLQDDEGPEEWRPRRCSSGWCATRLRRSAQRASRCRRPASRGRTRRRMGCAGAEGARNPHRRAAPACGRPVSADTPPLIVIARARRRRTRCGAVLKALTTRFGGKGGGRPELAQGGGFTATPHELLDAVRTMLAQP